MIKFQAIGDRETFNEDSDSQSNEDVLESREAQEDTLNKLYYDALQAASKGNKNEAIELLTDLKTRIESGNCNVHDTVHLERLKYLTYKNIGIFSNDVKSILQALEIDSSDFNLWVSAGKKSKEEYEFAVSKHCFETAFKKNPQNTIVIDNLIEVYFCCNELYNCADMCLYALKMDSQYYKALILLNESLSFDKMLIKDFDNDYMNFISQKLGGELDMEMLLNNPKFENYKSNLLKRLRKSQNQLFKSCLDEDIPVKRKEFILQSKNCTNLSEISKLILGFYEQIQGEGLSVCSKIVFEEEPLPDEEMIDEQQKQTQENSIQESQLMKQESQLSSQRSSMPKDSGESQRSAEELSLDSYVDKRRSTRHKKAAAVEKNVESKSEFEMLLDLFPRSLEGFSKSPILSKESSQASNISNIQKAENITLTKVFLSDLRDEFKCRNDQMNIYQLIRFYLVKLSSYKNFIIPDEFMKLYKIYREFEPIPGSYGTKIPEDITLEMMNVILTASEVAYNSHEAIFLQEMMGVLSEKMEPEEYRQFIVRLQVVLGNAKWDSDHLLYARDLCSAKPMFDFVFGIDVPNDCPEIEVAISNNGIIDISYLDNAIEMLSVTSDGEQFVHYKEIIRAYFTKAEINLTKENKNNLCEAIVALEIWQKGIDLIDSWHDLTEKCFEVIYHSVVENKIRITPNLAKRVAKRALDGKSIDLWKILQFVLENERCDAQTMVNFYVIAHNSMGKHGICTADGGKFLLQACDAFQNANSDEEAEKAYICLFNYPPKRKEHTCPDVPLEWEHCRDMLNFFFYEEPADYDSKATISPEEKDLLLRMMRLIPVNDTPLKCCEYIRNHIDKGGELGEKFTSQQPKANDVTLYIYYYLADFFFKSKKEFNQAKRFYIFDLTLNTDRFDSWAALALSINYEIDEMLANSTPNLEEYLKKVFSANQCFEQALKLQDCNKLRTENGLLFYSFANFLSRHKKLQAIFKEPVYEVPSFTDAKLQQMMDYDYILQKSKDCFETLNSSEDNEEPWLVNYMLGKISEKNMKNILQTVQYYEWSAQLLFLERASYPNKIQYVNNKVPHLSVEALEIHYRIHSAILKYLYRNSKFSARNLRKIKLCLIKIQKSPFMIRRQYSEKKARHVDDDCDAQVGECLNDLLDIIYEREKTFDVNQYRKELIQICKAGVMKCLERFPNHYKSYFRLADENDPKTVLGLLIGTVAQNRLNPQLLLPPDGKKSSLPVIPGLFCFEKGVFSNVYRLPVGDEIERSGKFAAHMFRLIYKLLDTSKGLEDINTLQQLLLFLQRAPEPEKRFLNEPERIALAKKCQDVSKEIFVYHVQRIKNRECSQEEMQRLFVKFPFMFKNR